MTEAGDHLQSESLTTVQSGFNMIPAEPLRNSCSSDVFQNEDIMELILSFFDPEAFWGDGIWDMDISTRKALLSASLTARSFVAPALGLLWRLMTSLIPVFKILPTFTKVNNVYTINGAMQTSHLDRLALYSCKVRYLYLQSFSDSIAAHFVSRLLIEKNFTLFPALKTLYIPSLTPPGFHSPNIDNFNPLFLIQGFSLTTLSIGGITSSTEALVASLLSVLSHRAIAVQDLILSGRLSLDILCFIESFTRLQGLNLTFDSGSVVPSAFIGYCGNLPDLTHLIINLNSATIDNSSLPIRSSVQGFERIQELRLRGDLDEISKILRSISQAPNLKTIIIGCMALLPNPVTVSLSIEAYIQDLARIAPSLQFLDANMGAGKTIVLPGGALRPLIQCRDLVRLEIAGVLLSITDDHIGELCAGDNWRNLRTLILPSSVDGKSPSLSSLQIFARNCPSLVNLTLPVDFRLHTPQTLKEERLRASRCSNAIEYLSIHKITTTRHDNETNTVAMGIAVSRFIEYCLPCLKVVTLNSESPAFDADWWRTVKTMIAEFRTVRHEAVSESLRSLS